MKQKLLLTICLVAASMGMSAQNADIIEQKMIEYGRMVNNRQEIYYMVDSVGKVSDVVMSSTIDPDLNKDIKEFFASLPEFSGSGMFMVSIVPAENVQKSQGTVQQAVSGERKVDNSNSNRAMANRDAQRKQKEIIKQPGVGLPPILEKAEKMPYCIGGKEVLMKYFRENMKYPQIAREFGSQGRILVSFVVERDGSISNAVPVKSGDPYLEQEAVRLILGMPKWMPGVNGGRVCRVRFTMPVTFKL
ncbi:MAG: energy transducer TonB [Prevotella sp.]|nr:energy transducer TonB [Prevotella sp.]MBR4268266.1 energy transducer TonB [Prevotella sp.]